MSAQFKIILVILLSTLIVSVTVKAVDKYNNSEKSPCPSDMVFVANTQGGFCIDKYEVSPSEDCPYPFPMNLQNTLANMQESECQALSQAGKRPWTYVSRDQAVELCRLAGKRLPSAAEWQSAALGTPDNKNCHLNNNWPKQPGSSGSEETCISAVGAYDMIGNVWEWVSDEVQEGRMDDKELPAAGYIQAMSQTGLPAETGESPNEMYANDYMWLKSSGLKAVAKGGYYSSGDEGGRYSTYIEAGSSFTGPGIGFRCVR